MKNLRYIISVVILVLVIAAAVVGFMYYRNMVFSTQVLSFEVSGPDTAQVGDKIEYTVTYKNNGNFTLEKPKISFYLPDNSLDEDNTTRYEKDLDNLEPGAEGSVTFNNIVLVGKENDEKIAKASFSYIPHNLSVRYESDATFSTKLGQVPIDLAFNNLAASIEQGKNLGFSVSYLSHIDYPLENISIKIDPISDFTVQSAVPSSLDKSEWRIGTSIKDKGGNIQINGVVSPTAADHVTFAAHLGMWQGSDFIVLKEINQDVAVTPSTSPTPSSTSTTNNQPSN